MEKLQPISVANRSENCNNVAVTERGKSSTPTAITNLECWFELTHKGMPPMDKPTQQEKFEETNLHK